MLALTHRLLLALSLAMLAHISSISAACISLKQSQGCPGFSREYISTNATSRFSWYPKDDIGAFDKALSDYVNGQANLDEFQSVFRCPGLDNLGGFNTDHGMAVVRYHRSMICADLLFSEDNVRDCYGGSKKKRRAADRDPMFQLAEVVASSNIGVRPDVPTPLCQGTCNSWVDSLHTIITNNTLCQADKGIIRESSLASLRTKCQSSAYNGAEGRCIDGDDNELRTCGFQRVEDWCKYCNFASDYVDTCASVGVTVIPATTTMTDSTELKDKHDLATPNIDRESNRGLIAELAKQSRQERVFRIVAIVLSITVGIFLLMLIAAIVMGRGIRGSSSGGALSKRGFFGTGRDDTTLASQTGEGASEKAAADFVDCFITTVGKPRQVIRHFFARRDDEISLQKGDIVTLQMAFDDGWVVGKNLTTGCEGTFPLMCVMDSLPASLPAQWSVLPESKTTSMDNVRAPSRAAIRSPHASLLGGMSMRGSLEAPPAIGSVNVSRMSNISDSRGPAANAGLAQLSHKHQGTRTAMDDNVNLSMGDLVKIQNNSRGKALLDRLIGAFTPAGDNTSAIALSSSGSSSSSSENDALGFFKRLVVAPFGGTREKTATPVFQTKKNRPQSFNVNHVVHVGLASPNYPRPGDLNISVPTFPSSNNGPSLNGYPIMSNRSSMGTGGTYMAPGTDTSVTRMDATEMPAVPLGFPRPPNFSYGEFAPSNSSRSMNLGNSSIDTYQTAEQFVSNGLAAATSRNPS